MRQRRAFTRQRRALRFVTTLGLLAWPAMASPRLPAAALQGLQPRSATGSTALPSASPEPDLRPGRVLLETRQFVAAGHFFSAVLRKQPGDAGAQLGLGDARLGLHEYEAAEAAYRAAVAQQPELWQAHRNLVVVEAALGRWEDFEGERRILRLARERGAPGISTRESDVIDSFDLHGGHWVVRAYFQPVGRSETVYNFERFAPNGRVEAYISLENAAAAQAALHPGDVRIGSEPPLPAAPGSAGTLALNWYTGAAHGTIRNYPEGAPEYRQVRQAALHWLRDHPVDDGAPRNR